MKGSVKFIQGLVFVMLVHACSESNQPTSNRLSTASSPYLRQHADNPVDWYEWGDEALAKAKELDKPLLVSIGYASCHWCHEMENESFMDTSVARLMNENFICIKVDREERPDIDNLYVHACQLLNNGQAGWPLNAFALPDGKPFFAGTYFDKNSWKQLLLNVADAYKNKRSKVMLQASSLTFGMIDSDSLLLVSPENNFQKEEAYSRFFLQAYNSLDKGNGGIRGQQKFPTPSLWEFFLQYHYFTSNNDALTVVVKSLNKMALSGLYDPIGGGFFRYSTDSLWNIPHFEKMLYDNAQLISLYANAYRLTKTDHYRQIAEETIQFVEEELSAGNGAYFSSLSADTKEGEGHYYLWEKDAISKAIGKNNPLANYFSAIPIEQKGISKLLPVASHSPANFIRETNLTPEKFASLLGDARLKLLSKRNRNSKPAVDRKIILSWNALMLKGFLDAYAAFGKEEHLEKAISLAHFIEKNLVQDSGKLNRVFSNGRPGVNGFLEDYAFLSKAYIRLYELDFDMHWLQMADKLVGYTNTHFFDPKSGLYFFSAEDSKSLAVKKIEVMNNVMPPSNAIMAEVLFQLGILLQNKEYSKLCEEIVKKVSGNMVPFASAAPEWGIVEGMFKHNTFEVAIVGPDARKKSRELQSVYLPDCLFLGGNEENLPLLEGKKQPTGTWIYVCTNKMCKRPETEVDKAMEQINPKK